jgi:hypothetical protein
MYIDVCILLSYKIGKKTTKQHYLKYFLKVHLFMRSIRLRSMGGVLLMKGQGSRLEGEGGGG